MLEDVLLDHATKIVFVIVSTILVSAIEQILLKNNMFKVNNKCTKTKCENSLSLTIKTTVLP